jgi:hypothetical protein
MSESQPKPKPQMPRIPKIKTKAPAVVPVTETALVAAPVETAVNHVETAAAPKPKVVRKRKNASANANATAEDGKKRKKKTSLKNLSAEEKEHKLEVSKKKRNHILRQPAANAWKLAGHIMYGFFTKGKGFQKIPPKSDADFAHVYTDIEKVKLQILDLWTSVNPETQEKQVAIPEELVGKPIAEVAVVLKEQLGLANEDLPKKL